MARQIRIRIDQAGNVRYEAEGFVGNSCKEATQVFEQAFVGTSKKDEDKPEAFAQGGTHQEQSW